MQAGLKVGDRVWARTPNEMKPARIVSIEAPPREMTGGRGIALRFDDGSFGDGWCNLTVTVRR